MVAAARVKGDLSPLAAWSLFAVILAAIAVGYGGAMGPRTNMMERIRPPLPRRFSRLKAEEAMRALGYEGACVDEASGFVNDEDAIRAAKNTLDDPAKSAEAKPAARRMILFWHRCSPVPLLSYSNDGNVTRDDPPLLPARHSRYSTSKGT